MKNEPVETTALPPSMRTWERFWFTPRDPTLLGALRILTGLLVVYTLIAYSFFLQDMMGEQGWVDLRLLQQIAHDTPHVVGTLSGELTLPPAPKPPKDRLQEFYLTEYQHEFITVPNYGVLPCTKNMVRELAKLKPDEYVALKQQYDDLIKEVDNMTP